MAFLKQKSISLFSFICNRLVRFRVFLKIFVSWLLFIQLEATWSTSSTFVNLVLFEFKKGWRKNEVYLYVFQEWKNIWRWFLQNFGTISFSLKFFSFLFSCIIQDFLSPLTLGSWFSSWSLCWQEEFVAYPCIWSKMVNFVNFCQLGFLWF